MYKSKYIIGIDLGTTNIAVTYIDTEGRDRNIKVFNLVQFNSLGETAELRLLPSYCFFPDKKTIPENSMDLPWNKNCDYAVGKFARDFGAATPNRFISSVKSWLCHAGVERNRKILPWGTNIENLKYSPVEVTSYYLKHIKDAWDYKFGKKKDTAGNFCFFAEQQIVITIPASFDETARELTLEAAKMAGYRDIHLLEEPLAAFYSWLDYHDEVWKEKLLPGESVLVVDIGGGTSDFSIIEMDGNGSLLRTAAGNHLLLGGDNIDMSIAKSVEEHSKTKFSLSEWLTLCQKARECKEELLSSDRDSFDIVLLSSGSSVIGGMKKFNVKKETIEAIAKNGFFPIIEADSELPSKRYGIQTMGLPYETEPSVTKHILAFLKYAYTVSTNRQASSELGIFLPNKILFNGGTLIPISLRKQILNSLHCWFPDKNIEELESRDLSLAVAYGASYYGRTRRGEGITVKSGTNSSFYLKIASGSSDKLVCVMNRGVDENIEIAVPLTFTVTANQHVNFPLFSSSTRLNDMPGDIIDYTDDIASMASFKSVLRFGKNDKVKLKVTLIAQFTETGILKIFLKSCESNHVWPLNFDIRLLSSDESSEVLSSETVFDKNAVDEASNLILRAFKEDKLKSLTSELEEKLELTKEKWPIQVLRKFADTIINNIPFETMKSVAYESKWLNFLGYCMRPGFGEPEDELRMKKLWNVWNIEMQNKNSIQVQAEWWIFWRRVSSGLRAGHQKSISIKLLSELYPKGKYQSMVKAGPHVKCEMWRCLGALELLSQNEKASIGNILTHRKAKLEDYEYWVLARLGARHLFHAHFNYVLPLDNATKWIKILLSFESGKNISMQTFALSRLAAMTGDRAFDLPSDLRDECIAFLEKHNAHAHYIKSLKTVRHETVQEQSKIFADSIPLGLILN